MKPNFFLVGAPKCGTTALAHYLRQHPRIFMSDPKEPCYLGGELAPLAQRLGIHNDLDYERLFSQAHPDQHCIIGEASTLYLMSPPALQAIRNRYPDCRVMAMVRDPAEVVQAFHMQMCLSFLEDEQDCQRAWQLQDARLRGESLPPGCRVPGLLQYRDVAAMGSQLKNLMDIFDHDQLLVISFDDFKADASGVYRRVLDFLGLPDDGRQVFPKVNESSRHRFAWLSRLRQSASMNRLAGLTKTLLPDPVVERLRPVIWKLHRSSAPRPRISEQFREELDACFVEQKRLMTELVRQFENAPLAPSCAGGR